MKKTFKLFIMIACVTILLTLTSCDWLVPNETTAPTTSTEPPHEHVWADATCSEPKSCECGETEGEALGHTWVDADCDTPKSCFVCGATEGEPLGHTADDGDCTTEVLCLGCNTVLIEKQEDHIDENGDYQCDNEGCNQEVLPGISTADELVAAFENGGKYKLTNSIDVGDAQLSLWHKSLELDLNTFTITTAFWNGIAVNPDAQLTIKNGTVISVSNNAPAIIAYGDVNVYNCNLQGQNYWGLYVYGANAVVENSAIKHGIMADESENAAVVIATNNVTVSDCDGNYVGISILGGSKIVLGFDPTDYMYEYSEGVVTDNGDGTWTLQAE